MSSDQRKFRARVATEVMGWSDVGMHVCGRHKQELFKGRPPGEPRKHVPSWEWRMADAWEVVERMQSLGFTVVVVVEKDKASCEMSKPKWAGSHVEEGPVKTLPRLICKAALACVNAPD